MNSGKKIPGRPFKPGQSGNPKGRPKEAFQIRDLARSHAEEAIRTLVSLMKKSDSDKVRVMAASALLDRGVGKPIQELQHTGEDGGPVTFTLKIGAG